MLLMDFAKHFTVTAVWQLGARHPSNNSHPVVVVMIDTVTIHPVGFWQ